MTTVCTQSVLAPISVECRELRPILPQDVPVGLLPRASLSLPCGLRWSAASSWVSFPMIMRRRRRPPCGPTATFRSFDSRSRRWIGALVLVLPRAASRRTRALLASHHKLPDKIRAQADAVLLSGRK